MHLLLESIKDKALIANKDLMTLGKELKTSSVDPTDEEIQAALLIKTIENGGNIKNIEPSEVQDLEAQIKEEREYLNESESVSVLVIEGLGTILGNTALLHAITHAVEKITNKKINEEKVRLQVQKNIKQLKNITGFPAKAMETFFKYIAKRLGGGELSQKVAGVLGTVFAISLLFVLGVILFPSTESIVLLSVSLTSLVGKAIEIRTLLVNLWKVIKQHKEAIMQQNSEELEQAVDDAMKNSQNIQK